MIEHDASKRCRNYVFKTEINHAKNIAQHVDIIIYSHCCYSQMFNIATSQPDDHIIISRM